MTTQGPTPGLNKGIDAYPPQDHADAQLVDHGVAIEREAAKRDGLGLLTNAAFREVLDHSVPDAQNLGTPLSVLMSDLDGFKEVNDNFGHPRGDEVIYDVKEIFSGLVQESDGKLDAGSLGGDEVGAICLGGEEDIEVITQELEKRFNEYLDRPGNEGLREAGLGISFGTATLSKNIMTASELMKEADDAMYEHKMSKLGELNRRQRLGLAAARGIIKLSKIRNQDAVKLLRSDNSSKPLRQRDAPDRLWRKLGVRK